MPFDGTVVYAVCRELRRTLLGGRIDKIYQPEPEEIVISLRSLGRMQRLLLSADAGGARLQLTDQKPETPLTPPMFCMLFRKYFGSGKLLSLEQQHFDRIVELQFEVLNELRDPCRRRVILEMMGKHSNLILVDENGRILDAVRHVTPLMSSVRAVQPGLPYTPPSHTHKKDPLEAKEGPDLRADLAPAAGPLSKALVQTYNGLCPVSAREILALSGLKEDPDAGRLTAEQFAALETGFRRFFRRLTEEPAQPVLYRREDQPADFSVFPYESLAGLCAEGFADLWTLLDSFYRLRDVRDKIKQKAQDLHHLLSTNLDRARRKEALQLQQLADTEDRELDRIRGELLTANLYRITEAMTSVRLENYYEEGSPQIEIPLDPSLSPSQNAQRYYRRYNKKKRTEQALTQQLSSTREEIRYLESIEDALALADCEKDLEDLRAELHQTGYIRRTRRAAKNLSASRPLTFTTSEGMEVLVGKNNIQNDALTFKTSDPYDLWLHVKDIPGSHVILRIAGKIQGQDYTEQSILEAARLAARHSKGAGGTKVPVDYTLRRYVKKPAGAKPGFVIYTHQTTLYVEAEGPAEA